MNLVAQLVGVGIADLGTPGQAELLAVLLADKHAGNGLRGAVALGELIGIGVGLDAAVILFSAADTGIVDAVGVHLVDVGAFGLVGDVGQAVPGLALTIGAIVFHDKQDTLRYAILILAIFGLVPGQTSSRHDLVLL